MQQDKAFKGSRQSQRFDAVKSVEHLIEVKLNTKATNEVTRWRASAAVTKILNQKLIVEEKKITHTNAGISKRLYDIMEVDRKLDTTEYSPGYRFGTGSMALLLSLIRLSYE